MSKDGKFQEIGIEESFPVSGIDRQTWTAPFIRAANILKGHFTSLADITREQTLNLVDLAIGIARQWKEEHNLGALSGLLNNKELITHFAGGARSLRTFVSMNLAMNRLGGSTVSLDPAVNRDIALKGESTRYGSEDIRDVAAVCNAFLEGSGTYAMRDVRPNRGDQVIKEMKENFHIPVINMETWREHPLQVLADLQTIKENFPYPGDMTAVISWGYSEAASIKPPAPNQDLAANLAKMGIRELRLAYPPEFPMSPQALETINHYANETGTTLRFFNNLQEAMQGADLLYLRSYGQEEAVFEAEKINVQVQADQYKQGWTATEELIQSANSGCRFMHCMPMNRAGNHTKGEVENTILGNKEISLVPQEAGNRVTTAAAVLAVLLGDRSRVDSFRERIAQERSQGGFQLSLVK